MSEHHLVRAAKARHEAAAAKAQSALRQLSSRGQQITFASVAREAGVSTDFLYRHPELRNAITGLRTPTSRSTGVDDPAPSSAATTAAVRALSSRLKQLIREHREEVETLKRDLATAHGENLLLRRRLAAHEDVYP